MIFDGDYIKLGDTMFDMVYGKGTVSQVKEHEQKFVVVFPGDRQFTYELNGAGQFPNRKTLFWRDPIGAFIPMKNDDTWHKFLEIQAILAKVIGER